jgi:tRNA(Arg) A34 adenosine deaminase TadA
MITAEDSAFLRRAIEIAAAAITSGDAPYGSLLVDAHGAVLMQAHNTVERDRDISAHPELKLARWAARELSPETAAATTMYTSCQPCGMCTGAIIRSGLGRVVYDVIHRTGDRAQPRLGLADGAAGRASLVRRSARADRALLPSRWRSPRVC